MKKKNGGFIATSLIYSFFLVFVAVIAALLNNYIANKTIMERYNLEAARDLNTGKHTVSIYAKNANIVDGMTLTNLVSNSNFTSSAYWQRVGPATFTYANNRLGTYSVYKIDSGYNRSYLTQQIHFQANSKYYYSISHLSATTSNFLTYIDSTSNGYLNTANSKSTTWTRTSGIYSSPSSNLRNFIVGDSSSGRSVFLTHAMVVNLTSSFGKNYEPDREWIDENLDYFEGTISYIRKEQISSGESLLIRFMPFVNYDRYSITCVNPNTNRSISGYNVTTKREDSRTYKEFKLNYVNSDIRCNIDWRQ